MRQQSFTIRKQTYEIKKGDYIMYNGSCYQFFSGDGRVLKYDNLTGYNSIVLTTKAFSQLDLTNCKVVEKDSKYTNNKLTYWIF